MSTPGFSVFLLLPPRMVDNKNSLLDLTDLVIIDAIGTGYSRSLEDSNDPFIGYDNDVRTMGDFIRQYVNRNSRWGSRKYIAGEYKRFSARLSLFAFLAADMIALSSKDGKHHQIPDSLNQA